MLSRYSLQQNFYEVICNGQPRHIYIDYDRTYETNDPFFKNDNLSANQFMVSYIEEIFDYLVEKGLDANVYDYEYAILTSSVNNEKKKKN